MRPWALEVLARAIPLFIMASMFFGVIYGAQILREKPEAKPDVRSDVVVLSAAEGFSVQTLQTDQLFDTGCAKLKDEKKVADMLTDTKMSSPLDVLVIGYADARGEGRTYDNRGLSDWRAKAVADVILKSSPESRVRHFGVGAVYSMTTCKVASPDADTCLKNDRRVEVWSRPIEKGYTGPLKWPEYLVGPNKFTDCEVLNNNK